MQSKAVMSLALDLPSYDVQRICFYAEAVAKVFNASCALPVMQKELDRSKKAFLTGILTAISYELVRVGDCYGTVLRAA